ncbi:MAG: ABC transporter ATP-binding protein [Streptococcaceae bacterium]|jgi:ABC-2 type transport system ATP-binding protein|nr:ABC transporter ATP-binding protein [Streptococcaceae bacterium]
MNLEVSQLSFAYGTQQVLDISSVKFDSGHIYGIVGQNGVGKTTFFKALTNIITNYTGAVKFDEVLVKENPAILTKVGIMLDDMELYKAQTGLFNLRYFGGLRGGFDEENARSMAAALGIADSLDKKVSGYSLGMGKKLILLISLMNSADVLIFDEPFRGIDATSVAWVREKLLQLKQENKLILISSHVQEDIESICDTVYLLDNGDFKDSLDLTDTNATMTYTVAVSDVAAFAELLSQKNIPAMTKNNLVKFDSTSKDFQALFSEAVKSDITFDEIKKTSTLAGFINGATKGGYA